ncbi:MAG: RNA-binding protein [Bilifractor sp.]|jgi:RNA-binding protein YlmH
MNDDERFRKRITELANLAFSRGIVMFSDFLDLNQQNILRQVRWSALGVSPETAGGYPSAERKMAAFVPRDIAYEWSFPLVCLQIEPLSEKFSEELSHRDYLGSVLATGIERNVIGDILVRDHCAQLFAEEHIADFLIQELIRVRKTPVRLFSVESPDDIFEPATEEKTGSVASVRLDSVLALAFGGSRAEMNQRIRDGRVFVNARLVTSNGHPLHEGDLISVRQTGKCRFDKVLHTSKKGRLIIQVSRFI